MNGNLSRDGLFIEQTKTFENRRKKGRDIHKEYLTVLNCEILKIPNSTRDYLLLNPSLLSHHTAQPHHPFYNDCLLANKSESSPILPPALEPIDYSSLRPPPLPPIPIDTPNTRSNAKRVKFYR